jgi:hypothetical protein
VDHCIAMLVNPEGPYQAFPLQIQMGKGPAVVLVPATLHVEGRLDYQNRLAWREAGHRCDGKCLLGAKAIPSRQRRAG